MTIRMLQAWNGLHQQQIVTTLSGSDEAALVAAGIATYDLDGPAENLRMAQLATDADGDVVGIADPVGGGDAGFCYGVCISPILDTRMTAAAASANVIALQAAIDRAGPSGRVLIPANLGTFETNATVYHDNIIEIDAGTTWRLRHGSNTSMLKNKGWNPARVTATSMTAVGRVGTINFAGVPPAELTVGATVSVLGSNSTGYNGCHVITGRGATTLTVRLPRTPLVATAVGTVTVSPVDEAIGLIGKGTMDYNEAGQAADGTMNTIATIWANVGTCFVGEGLKFDNAKKFCFLIAGYRYADVDNLHAETASDIIHFLGPGTETVCSGVRGKSGDDSLAFTIGDVAWFNISRGDFFSIRVDDLNCDSEQALIRISGNPGWKFYDVTLKSLNGSSVTSPVAIADFNADLQGLDFDHIKIDGVNCETATAVPVVAVSTLITGMGDRLDVNVTQLPSNGEALSINASTTTVRSVNLKVANPLDGCTKGALLVANATVNSASVEGIRATYASNTFAVWVAGTVNELRLHDIEVSGSGSRVVAQQGTVGRVFMSNVRHTSGYRTFEQSAAANAGAEVFMSNVRVNTITHLAHFEKAATLVTTNTVIQSGGATAGISANGASTVVSWSGDARFNGVAESALAGGATIDKVNTTVA